MRKVLTIVVLSLTVAVASASIGAITQAQDEDPQYGGRLGLVAADDLTSLDNSQALALDYNVAAGALYEGLYHFTPSGALEPALAEGLPEVSDDGLVYTFRMKPGAMFAGPDFEPRAVTAADVAYGMTRALAPTPDGAPTQSWGAGYLFPIKGAEAFARGKAESVDGIEAVDDHTLRITLEAPATTFLLGLTVATSWPVPEEAVKERGDDFASRPVGAGPFYLQEWNEGTDITLTRNPGYVDPELPYLDEIHIDLGIDESTQVARLQAGEADGTLEQFALSPTSLQLLEQDPGLTTVPSVGPRVFYLALNNDGIFADKRLRQAVAQAMTSDFTAQFGGIAKPWNQLISSTTAQSAPEATTTYVHDPEVAAALLESADYDGTPIKIVYDVTDPYGSASATALRQDPRGGRLQVSLDALQRSQFHKDIYDPADFDVSPIYWSADYPDAQDFIATNFVCGSIGLLNISRFCDEDIDTAFAETERMPFGPERDAALLEVQQRLIDELAGIPVMEITPQVVFGPRVGDLPTLATYAPFDWKRAWVKVPE